MQLTQLTKGNILFATPGKKTLVVLHTLCEKHRVDTVWNLDVAKFMFLLGLETNYRKTSYFDFFGNHSYQP
jgi:hypothetical protein